ncbi:hypothetical protein [Chroococcidiopsis sp.]|uniref:hypothetical protein n=1 Tax=Chroococcidiopsis sp. TaxID=3088168 RepID=UPI003F3DD3B3
MKPTYSPIFSYVSHHSMKISASSLTKIFFGAVVGMSLATLLLPQLTWAQATTDAEPLRDLNQEQNRDPFSRGDTGDAMSGLMDIMHRAQMGNIRSAGDFATEQNQSLDDAAAKFRQQQLQRIQQNPSQPNNPTNQPRQQ